MQYHQICIKNEGMLCFRDNVYLCICADDHSRVECFRYEDRLDHCSRCLSGGRCLQGYHKDETDFMCLCPACHSGRRCQFSSKSFAFTLDQLLYTDLTSTNKERNIVLLILFSVLGFVVAIPNNLFSFVTFRRRECLRDGVGHYLLTLSCINQIALGIFCARLIHLVVILSSHSTHSIIQDIICKVLGYSLTCFTRISLWLASFVAMERVYTTMFLTKQWFKQPHIARRLMTTMVCIVLSSAAYELVFTRSFSDLEDGTGTICVSEYPLIHQSIWLFIHQFVAITNFLVPLLINICCTCTIVVIVIRTKMNLYGQKICK